MTQLETTEHWAQILELKDQISLRELATRFDTTPGAISAAMRRTGTARAAKVGATPAAAPASRPAARRAGARPDWWGTVEADLDTVPISELAARVGVSPGQFAQELKGAGYRRVAVETPAQSKPKRRRRRARGAATTGQQAWAVTIHRGDRDVHLAVIASDLTEAAAKASALEGTVAGLTLVGDVVA